MSVNCSEFMGTGQKYYNFHSICVCVMGSYRLRYTPSEEERLVYIPENSKV